MADMENICARLCLLTRAAWRKDLPSPLMRATVRKMIRLGALEGLTLRQVPGVKEEHYACAEALLSRSVQVYDTVQRCIAQGYSIILPEDDIWPVNLCALGAHMPHFLFLLGNPTLFSRRTVSVAGSRRIDENTAEIARYIGQDIARQGCALVCGGAKGVDTAVQTACLASGGSLILVPAYPCRELLRQEYLQRALSDNQLLIACDAWPDERFTAQKALTRNHAIYALGDAAVAVAAREGIGGTWRGAQACLRGGYTPVFALCEPGEDFAGTRAMTQLGARALDLSKPLSAQLFAGEG